jgi:4-diphosphocytidyl-2-C-methyl-D-erythritol kinase
MRAYWTAPPDARLACELNAETRAPRTGVSAAGPFSLPFPAPSPAVSFESGELTVWAPAKLNLFLEILGKRPDGFHELETLMLPVSLYDTLQVRRAPESAVSLSCHASRGGKPAGLPEDRGNLAYRAADSARGSGEGPGVTLRLVKRIPSEAGMAGGSTDAAAALLGTDAVLGKRLSRETLAEKAAQLGSDVPFFLANQAAVCRGRGERISPAVGLAGLSFVVVKPGVGLSTAQVFRACRPAESPRSAAPLVEALALRDWRRVGPLVFNRLEEAAAELSPAIAALRRSFAGTDVVAHQMSGSGTSYFGLCRSAAHARQIAGRMRALGLGEVFVVRSL